MPVPPGLPDGADFIGLVLLIFPVITLVTVVKLRRRPTPWAALVVALLCAIALPLIFFPVFADPGASPPLRLWTVPMISGAVLCCCVRPTALQVVGVLLGFVTPLILIGIWRPLVVGDRSYATEDQARRASHRVQRLLTRLREGQFPRRLSSPRNAAASLPAGFLDEGWYKEQGFPSMLYGHHGPKLQKIRLTPRWHTPITGLYKADTTPLSVWTPGGTPEEAARGLELRERPTP